MRKLCFLLALCVAQPAPAAGDALQKFVEDVRTLSANFKQIQTDEDGKTLQVSDGKVAIERAASANQTGKFRWSYHNPYEQLLLCDGKTIWMYDPDLAQVTARPAAQALAGTPAELLAQRGTLDSQFERTFVGIEDGAEHLKLVPRSPDSEFREIDLWFQNGVPSQMRFRDPLGGASEVIFTNIRSNVALDPKLFRFEVPDGVEVVRSEKPGN